MAKKTELNENAVEFEEALDAAGSGGKFQIKVVLIGSLALLSSYIAVGGISYILPVSQCDLKMDSHDKANLISAGFLGLAGGCHLWGFLSDRLGRRYVLVRCLFLDGILYVATSLTPYYYIMVVLRFFNGFASCGGVVSIYAYIGEFNSDKNRSKALIILSTLATTAYIILPGLAWVILPQKFSFMIYSGLIFKSWRLYYALFGIPSLTSAILIYFLPESPKFLLSKGDKTKALEVLQRIHKENLKKNQNENFLIKNIKINEGERLVKMGDNSNKISAFFTLMVDQTVPLFKIPHRFNTFLICFIQYLLYFGNGGIYLWLPESMNRMAVFKNLFGDKSAKFCEIIQYKQQKSSLVDRLSGKNNYSVNENILSLNNLINNTKNINDFIQQEQCNDDVDVSVYLHLEILGLVQVVALSLVVLLIIYFKKKHIIGLCTFLSSVSIMLLFVVPIQEFMTAFLITLIVLSGAAIATVNTVMVDLFPTNMRAMAGCLSLMSSRVGTVTANMISGRVIDNHCLVLLSFTVISLLGAIVLILLLPSKPLNISDKKATETS